MTMAAQPRQKRTDAKNLKFVLITQARILPTPIAARLAAGRSVLLLGKRQNRPSIFSPLSRVQA